MTAPTPSRPGSPCRPAWAHYLVTLRHRRHLSAKEVAARLGITPQTYAGIEAGTRTRNGRRTDITVKDETLHRLVKALDLNEPERRHLIALVVTSAGNRNPWQTRLKLARVSASLSVTDMANAAGVTDDTYREWERKGAGVPRHDSLRKAMARMGWDVSQADEFMATLPPDTLPARAPRQPTNPIAALPEWSQHITRTRLAAGLHLSHVDERIGQQSIVRRFELGGWPRTDGRLSVPSRTWLDRVATALDMAPPDRAHLHACADEHRIVLAREGSTTHHRPLLSELLHEARKAADLPRAQCDEPAGISPGTWSRAERGLPDALAHFTLDTIDRMAHRLPVCPVLTDALTEAVTHASEPADITHNDRITPAR